MKKVLGTEFRLLKTSKSRVAIAFLAFALHTRQVRLNKGYKNISAQLDKLKNNSQYSELYEKDVENHQ